ncbi:MAG: hypothetical protein IT307_09445 [Chloroflexi bacterium]|nr:hypothetical protein [Chloroflexota bacterium]
MAHVAGRPTLRVLPGGNVRTPARSLAVTLEHVWLGLAVVAAALACALQPLEHIDYWWSVRLGSAIRELGTLPTTDPLLYTPVRGSQVDGQWLAKVLLSLLHDLGGVQAGLALRTVVAVGAALLLARACRTAGAGPRLAATLAGLSTVLFVPGLAVRPQLLAVLPFLVVLHATLVRPRSPLGIAGVALAVVFWANVHGSFILIYPLLGVGILAAAVSWWRSGDAAPLRQAILLAGVCGVAPVLNPYGLGLAAYVGDTVLFNGGGTSVGVLGVEWGAPEIRSAYGALFYGSVLLVIGLFAAGVRPRLTDSLLLLGFGVLAVSSVRHILWWSLVMTPFAARGLAELGSRPGPRWLPRPGPLPAGSPGLNVVCIALFGLLVVAALPWWRERLPLPPARTALLSADTPVAVAEHLAAHPPVGRLFNDTDWSAYFGWRLAPDTRVFVDNRFELHPPEIWEDYQMISRGHVSWERRLAAHGITMLALNPRTQAGLVSAVRDAPNWTLAYEDRQALVFVRADAPAP